jgi:hypothetical protein
MKTLLEYAQEAYANNGGCQTYGSSTGGAVTGNYITPTVGRTWWGVFEDDPVADGPILDVLRYQSEMKKWMVSKDSVWKQFGTPTKEGIEMLGLYNVVMVYAEDRKNLKIEEVRGVIAAGPEDAKVKSGLMAKVDKEWDADYLTLEAMKVMDVKVKAKPQEVKQV